MNLNCSQTWNVSIQDESERQLENGTSRAWEMREKLTLRLRSVSIPSGVEVLNQSDKVPRDSGKRKCLISRSVGEPTVGDVVIVCTNVF